MMPGGLSHEKQEDNNVRSLVDSLKTQIESTLAIKLGTDEVIDYKTQVVAGLNYYVKIKADGEYCLLRIFNPLPAQGSSSLTDAKSINVNDEIGSF
ncbi:MULTISPECIES: cystatin domain-containing protein [unclassified Pseudomonas]|uniref:cystatin domain-containing protein n=1 Tax=unclassified Pseudomonas TaxID=196821 RepID=UPI0025EB18AD|nr:MULTISPECIES: cystatin domain-containing protein [unclassified Pseudomonas]